jgi:hypothetical protein
MNTPSLLDMRSTPDIERVVESKFVPAREDAALQAGPHQLAGSDETAFTVLHKEKHIGLPIKDEPEYLWIRHAGKKGTLNGFWRHGRMKTTFGRSRPCIPGSKGVLMLP